VVYTSVSKCSIFVCVVVGGGGGGDRRRMLEGGKKREIRADTGPGRCEAKRKKDEEGGDKKGRGGTKIPGWGGFCPKGGEEGQLGKKEQ